mgnify:FL=1
MSVEGRAYRMAHLSVKNEADALDIVQDTMIKLATSYGHLEADGEQEQWRPLFYKILQNCIMDFHRKESRIKRWFVRSKPDIDDIEDDSELDNLSLNVEYSPEEYLQQSQMGEKALQAVDALPDKQQQCFLLRCWEGFSVQETAQMMNISEGSVKTHYHRALHKLQEALNLNEEA